MWKVYEGNDFGPTLVMPSETTPTDLVEEDIPSRGDMVFNTYSIDKYFVKCGFVSGGTQNPPCDKKLLNVADTMVILFTKSQSQITKPAPPLIATCKGVCLSTLAQSAPIKWPRNDSDLA